MDKIQMPSLGAILHFLLLETISQLLWWGASKMLSITSIIRDIGFLVIFVAVIIAVALYLPKISPSLFKRKGQSKRRIDTLGWLPNKVDDIWYHPTQYVYSRLIKVFSSSPTEIGIVIEWFNFSMYDLKFESINGEVSMGEIGFDFESLGHQIIIVGEYSLSMLSHSTCTCHLLIGDSRKLEQINEAIQKNKPLTWKAVLNSKLSTVGFYNERTFTAQQTQESITMIPSRS